MIFTTVFISAIYAIIIILIYIGIINTRKFPSRTDLKFSVIIPCYNEENNLPTLIEALDKLSYPSENYEVILIDDCSEDKTNTILKLACLERKNWIFLEIKSKSKKLKGKKKAITEAIQLSQYPFILTTDADCSPSSNWINYIAGCYTNKEIGMVLGHSPVRKTPNFSNKFQIFDHVCSSAVIMSGCFYNNPPTSCARNMSYRKQAFLDVNGYQNNGKIPSGDDIFLTKNIATKTKWKFNYALSSESFVETKPLEFSTKFRKQQMRRNGKVSYWQPIFWLLGTFISLFYIWIFILLIKSEWLLFSLIIAFKSFIEFCLFATAAWKLEKKYLISSFMLISFLYPIHIFYFSFAGSLKSIIKENTYA